MNSAWIAPIYAPPACPWSPGNQATTPRSAALSWISATPARTNARSSIPKCAARLPKRAAVAPTAAASSRPDPEQRHGSSAIQPCAHAPAGLALEARPDHLQ